MTIQHPIVSLLYVTSVVVPIIGLARLFVGTRASAKKWEQRYAERGHTNPTWGDMGDPDAGVGVRVIREYESERFNLLVIAVGLFAGAIAGVWSMFL